MILNEAIKTTFQRNFLLAFNPICLAIITQIDKKSTENSIILSLKPHLLLAIPYLFIHTQHLFYLGNANVKFVKCNNTYSLIKSTICTK